MADDQILNAARAIRPYLADLVGLDGERIDRELARLLEQARGGTAVEDAILKILSQHAATQAWAAEFLQEGQPPDTRMTDRGFTELPGAGEYLPTVLLSCPEGDYVWYQRSAGGFVPSCPTHLLTLVPVSRGDESDAP